MEHHESKAKKQRSSTQAMQRRDDVGFQSEADALIKNAEQARLQFMEQHRSRSFLAMSVGIVSLLIGGAGFGWFLLMNANLLAAIGCMLVAVILPIMLNLSANKPIKAYKTYYKDQFMPSMAKAMGGLKFHPSRGISAKILPKTGIIPAYDTYAAEDCFMGTYKDVKVILSEARLHKDKTSVFDGIFVLLEIPNEVIEGHTIITADQNMIRRWAPTRWKKLQKTVPNDTPPEGSRFEVYADNPESANLLVGQRLLTELAEASDIFDNSALSAVLFRKKFIFITIPYEENMFEASNMYVPVATREHAMNCKREIEQILEIIDVFEIYKSSPNAPVSVSWNEAVISGSE